MLNGSEKDFIARSDIFTAVALRNKVDRLGRAAQENDFLRVRCTDEIPYFVACAFERTGRPFRQFVSRPVDV